MQLSQYFKLEEFEYSDTARAYGIDNSVPKSLIPNIVRLHDNVLYPLRKLIGHPVNITSGYRCPDLNSKVGGAVDKNGKPTSQHCNGQAADITVTGQSNMAIFNWIRKNCDFDQLILESVNGSQWVHVSYNFDHNRKQCLSYDGRQYKAI